MLSFRFRLERLLGLRRAKEDVAQRELAEARRAVREETRRLTALLAEAEEVKRASRESRLGALDLAALRIQEGFLSSAERRAWACRERLAALGQVEAEKRRGLVEAMKGVKALERFRERKLAEWIRARELEERKALDEAGAARREGA